MCEIVRGRGEHEAEQADGEILAGAEKHRQHRLMHEGSRYTGGLTDKLVPWEAPIYSVPATVRRGLKHTRDLTEKGIRDKHRAMLEVTAELHHTRTFAKFVLGL